MYTMYDCLAVDHVYADADLKVQEQFKTMMHQYDEVWAHVPVLHGNREELHAGPGETLLTLFKHSLQAYQ